MQHLSDSQRELGAGAAGGDGAVEPVRAEQIVPGVEVQVRGFKQPVIVRQFDGRAAEVQAGPLRMKIGLADIVAVVKEEIRTQKAELRTGKQPSTRVVAEPGEVADEINVIGMTVEQASEVVDKFLDNAMLAGKARVRIIHGHGTGALRRGLAEFLKVHPLVERFAAEDAERGGTAITVVELRS